MQVRVLPRALLFPICALAILLHQRRASFLPVLAWASVGGCRIVSDDALSHVFALQQVLQCIPVDQGGSLVMAVAFVDLDAKDLAWCREDLADSQRLIGAALEDLVPKRVDYSLGAPGPVAKGVQIGSL